MGYHQTAIVNNTQEISNEILQSSNETCTATCDVDIDGVTVFVGNSTITNGINIGGDACSATASCVMNSELDTQLQNIINSITQQALSAEQPFLIPKYNSQTTITSNNQTLRNTITQMMNSSCQSNSENLITDSYVYVKDSDVSGGINIGFTQSGSSKATCSMNNISSANVYNKETANTDQVQKWENTIAVIITVIVIVMIVIGLIIFLTMGKGHTATPSNDDSGVNRNIILEELLASKEGGNIEGLSSAGEGSLSELAEL